MSAVVATRGLTFAYRRGSPPVLRDLTKEFVPGAVTAVTGPSGSGKSTLLYVLALMLRADSGAILWRGQEVSSLPDRARAALRAARMGFVFQDAMLDPARTVLENVCEAGLFAGMPWGESRRRAMELLEEFGVEDRAGHRPGEVSGGQAQRVGLCRALLTGPEVIFADEPSGNLDAASAAIVWDALVRCARADATVIVATHDLHLVSRADDHVALG